MVKNLLAMRETQVQSLGQEDPLENGMATHSSILAWEIPWTEESGGLQSLWSERVGHNSETNTHFKQLDSVWGASLMAQRVKNLPAMQETRV